MIDISFTLNGETTTITTDPLRRLLDILRDDLGLTGTKEGCGEGECGACTVLLDGKPVTSCIVNAVAVHGHDVTTIEGVSASPDGRLLIDCLYEAEAVQCGFCFPGIVMSALAYMRAGGIADNERIRAALAGNLCRCTGYEFIVKGVAEACRRWRDL
ncbi:MAG: (2Fe-2S)-binding protein [Candidatus Cloacimonetes bacterium]|nr:(2Fe-2S)-binding protein [Candidatus Cloacimonadota bacterium]